MRCSAQQQQALARLEQANTPDWQQFKDLLVGLREEARKQLEQCGDDRLLRQLQGRAQLIAELQEQFAHGKR